MDLFSVLLSSAVISTVVSGVFSYVVYRNKRFNETVTQKRIEYLVDMRNISAELCSIVLKNSRKERKSLLYNKLRLMLNPFPKDAFWDEGIIQRLDEMYNDPSKESIDAFVRIMQANLSLEWHGLMKEGAKGKLREKDKIKLRVEKYYDLLKYERK